VRIQKRASGILPEDLIYLPAKCGSTLAETHGRDARATI